MPEKNFCRSCEYYYSEMFTCPICYGEERATNRIIKLLEQTLACEDDCDHYGCGVGWKSVLIEAIKGKAK